MKRDFSKKSLDMKKKILVSAAKNFAKKGYAVTSLKDIALDAKISKGGLYHHFSNKEDLFFAVCTENVNTTIKKTLDFFEKRPDIQLCKENTLLEDLEEYYDNVVVGTKDFERLWIEGIMESDHNVKLKKMLLKIDKDAETWGIQTLKQIRDTSNLLKGYSDLELYDIMHGFSALYKGIIVERLMGKNPKESKKAWVQTVYAIYNSKKTI